jgi:hypothetical protein
MYSGIYMWSGWVGVATVAILFPLTITGFWVEEDYITAACISWLLVIGIAHGSMLISLPIFIVLCLNRIEQAGFTLLLLMCIRPGIMIPFGYAMAMVYMLLSPRRDSSWKAFKLTMRKHMQNNTDRIYLGHNIMPLWIPMVVLPTLAIIPCIMYLPSPDIWIVRLLIPYTLLFTYMGNMWELAKFLPFWIILSRYVV